VNTAASRARAAIEDTGALALLAGRSLRIGVRRLAVWRRAFTQIDALGVRSIVIAVLTAVFSAMVMTLQFTVQLARFGAQQYVGDVVALSIVRELGPVLTALLVGGRIGAGITAEIGSMRVTDQIDALRSMGADPIAQLVVPRVIAGAIALPILTIFADLLGVAAAMLMATVDTSVRVRYFYSSIVQSVSISDVAGGLVKSVCFGAIVTVIACHHGLQTHGGTEGVGRATTRTVVFASVAVIISDFLLTKGLLAFGL
jgi:phospholipid/cholesterol/gamma-HCH transport system permease protein